jgi:glycosyltransferase involved in cell wall biosynthesis
MEHCRQPDAGGAPAWLEIVVPARNEAGRLSDGLATLCLKAATLPPGVGIIVVDSASTDGTGEIVSHWPAGPVPVRLIRCDRPGKGAAVRAGLLATRARYIGFCDADMATDLAALDVAIARLRGGDEMVLGSRAHPDSVVEVRHSAVRRLGAAVFRIAARMVVPGVHDTQCGFKFFSGELARAAAADLRSVGFAFDIELISRARRLSTVPPAEIPVIWRDVEGSTFSVWRHSIAVFWGVLAAAIALRRSGPDHAGSARVGSGRAGSARTGAGPALMAGKTVAVVNRRDPWHPLAGGAERYAWEMAAGLARRGATVRYITSRGAGQQRRACYDEIDVVRLGGSLTVYPRALAWLALRRRSLDTVLDCQNAMPFFTPGVLARRTQIVRMVHHVQDQQFGGFFRPVAAAVGRWLEGPAARWCYRRRASVAVSDSTAAAMRARLGWPGPIHIVPNGLSAGCFALPPGVLPGDAGEEGWRVLTVVGRLVARKRVDRVLAIAERLRDHGFRIEIIGKGPESGSLAIQVAERGLEDVVLLRGFLSDAEKRSAVARSDLHISASEGAGGGLSVLEAAALGVPTVAYDVDGLRDAVRDGQTGWLVGDGEMIEDVTERALKELADPRRRADMAAACRSWAASFESDRSAEQLISLLIAGPSAPSGNPVLHRRSGASTLR